MEALLFERVARVIVDDRAFAVRIGLDIEKKISNTANKAKITLYNLSESSRSFVEEAGRKVVVEAGYNNLSGVIFKGTIIGSPTHSKNGPDIITTLEAGDAYPEIKNSKVNISLGKNGSLSDVFDVAKKAMNLGVGAFKGFTDKKLDKGFSFSGMASDVMDMLGKEMGLDWGVRDNELMVLPRTYDTGEEAVVLSASTGMIGMPTKTADGFSAISLLNPLLNVGKKIILRSKTLVLDGEFVITSLKFTGDSSEGPWQAVVEGVKNNGNS